MKIEVYAVCFNEEKILPYFLRHYGRFADIIIYDNYSTDRSVEIAHQAGAKVILFDTRGTFDDGVNLSIKENCWKKSGADWVIIIDTDEFVYHPNLPAFLENTKATVIEPKNYEMFIDHFPTTEGQIWEEVRNGHESWPKMNIFRPYAISKMNYTPGCHMANPEGRFVDLLRTDEVKTLHMKHLGRQYTIDRNTMYGARISENNRRNGWGTHLLRTPEQVGEDFDRLIKVVIPRI